MNKIKKWLKAVNWGFVRDVLGYVLTIGGLISALCVVFVIGCHKTGSAVEEVTSIKSRRDTQRILVRPCPKCQGTIIEQGWVVACRRCGYKKDWNKDQGL